MISSDIEAVFWKQNEINMTRLDRSLRQLHIGTSRTISFLSHGAAGAPRCATWYMVRAGQRAVHVASLIEAFMGYLIRAISL